MGRTKSPPPRVHDYDIRLTADGRPILFSWYKGHAFEGWISRANFEKAEADGVLAWDEHGGPIIRFQGGREHGDDETTPGDGQPGRDAVSGPGA